MIYSALMTPVQSWRMTTAPDGPSTKQSGFVSVSLAVNEAGASHMVGDAVMVALLRESILSNSPIRQVAARIVLDLTRRDSELPITPERLEVIKADEGPEVVTEIKALVQDLGLSGATDDDTWSAPIVVG